MYRYGKDRFLYIIHTYIHIQFEFIEYSDKYGNIPQSIVQQGFAAE